MSGPDFDELAEGTTPEERAQLRRAHDLLLAAGPPPELPPYLAEAPRLRKERAPALTTLPRKRFGALITTAVGVAAAAFVVGYLVANIGGSSEDHVAVSIQMKPAAAGPAHSAAVIDVLDSGEGGNIPLNLTVSGLPKLGEGGYYELWLTREVGKAQKRIVSCGTFVASGADQRFVVALNAPYRLEEGKPGWIVTRHVRGAKTQPVVLTT